MNGHLAFIFQEIILVRLRLVDLIKPAFLFSELGLTGSKVILRQVIGFLHIDIFSVKSGLLARLEAVLLLSFIENF